jgi:hypothetical protein
MDARELDNALDRFSVLLKRDIPSLEEARAVRPKSIYDMTRRDERVASYIHESRGCLKQLCDAFYGNSGLSAGDVWRNVDIHQWENEKLEDATLTPVPSSYDIRDAAALLSYTALYSGNGILVLPLKIEHIRISSFDSGYIFPLGGCSTDTILKAMLFNYRYRNLVEHGRLLFLPQVMHNRHESPEAYVESTTSAPLLQDPQNLTFTPLNKVPELAAVLAQREVIQVAEFLLPYFPDASLQDILRIKESESDSFVLFSAYLKRRLAALSEAKSLSDIEDIQTEITAGVARLRIEAKKVAGSKLMRNAEIGLFGLSLAGIISGDGPLTHILAGVAGSASLMDLLRSFSEVKGGKLDLRTSEFFIPYLLDR